MSRRNGRIRRYLIGTLTSVGLAVALAGCGIPDQTGVNAHGRGPEPGSGAADGTGAAPPGRTEAGDDVAQFATNFLRAPAGEATGAYERVNAYIPESHRHRAKPVNEVAINIVRLVDGRPRVTDSPTGPASVSIRVDQVGVLRADGSIEEPVLPDTEYEFRVGKSETDPDKPGSGTGLHVLDPPPVLLMDAEALATYYRPRMIYFWNADRSALVPDLRHMPLAVPFARQPTEVLSWLTGGPAEWLGGTAVGLPEGSTPIGNVPASDPDGRVEVNLAVKAGELDDETELNQIFTQLAWSLRDNLRGELELKVQGQQRKVADVADYLLDNPLYRVRGAPQRFAVYAGEVHPLTDPGVAGVVPIAAEANKDIRSAALARDGDRIWAALVTRAGERWRLRTGTGTGTVDSFVAGRGSYRTMSRPVWLKGSDPNRPIGLVVADGRLYRFGTDAVLTEVLLPNAGREVSAVGAALDGHRIAVIADNRLFVASLAIEGDTVTVGRARPLATTLRNPTVVDWSGENSLVLAGANSEDQPVIYQITTDGAVTSPVIEQVQLTTVTHLAAYPDNPMERSPIGWPMYEGNGVAYKAGKRITAEQVTGETQNPPSAGAENPTAPFFLY